MMVPITGAVGADGTAFITTLPVCGDVHPAASVTVNVYVPGLRADTVVLVPVPVELIAPGFLVSVQVPDEGRPLNATIPVDTLHVG